MLRMIDESYRRIRAAATTRNHQHQQDAHTKPAAHKSCFGPQAIIGRPSWFLHSATRYTGVTTFGTYAPVARMVTRDCGGSGFLTFTNESNGQCPNLDFFANFAEVLGVLGG